MTTAQQSKYSVEETKRFRNLERGTQMGSNPLKKKTVTHLPSNTMNNKTVLQLILQGSFLVCQCGALLRFDTTFNCEH
jgi:hypothetical protein